MATIRECKLRQQHQRIMAELHEISSAENEEKSAKLVGKTFVYMNSFGGGSAAWPLYMKAIRFNPGGGLVMFTFQTDCNGRVEINPNEERHHNSLGAEYVPCPPKRFRTAWRQLLKTLEGI